MTPLRRFAKRIADDTKKWARVIKFREHQAGIRISSSDKHGDRCPFWASATDLRDGLHHVRFYSQSDQIAAPH